jgi:hypothetical protein
MAVDAQNVVNRHFKPLLRAQGSPTYASSTYGIRALPSCSRAARTRSTSSSFSAMPLYSLPSTATRTRWLRWESTPRALWTMLSGGQRRHAQKGERSYLERRAPTLVYYWCNGPQRSAPDALRRSHFSCVLQEFSWSRRANSNRCPAPATSALLKGQMVRPYTDAFFSMLSTILLCECRSQSTRHRTLAWAS